MLISLIVTPPPVSPVMKRHSASMESRSAMVGHPRIQRNRISESSPTKKHLLSMPFTVSPEARAVSPQLSLIQIQRLSVDQPSTMKTSRSSGYPNGRQSLEIGGTPFPNAPINGGGITSGYHRSSADFSIGMRKSILKNPSAILFRENLSNLSVAKRQFSK